MNLPSRSLIFMYSFITATPPTSMISEEFYEFTEPLTQPLRLRPEYEP